MDRNLELVLLPLVSLLLTGGAAAIGFYGIGPESGCLALALGLLLTGCSLVFSLRRYASIRRLSFDLRAIRAGNYKLEIRDSREGELSILKSEIYKMTLMLSEQAELLRKDKRYLADALSDISHQLKTPLTSMLVMTELLGKPNLAEDKKRDFLRSIRSQLERIEWLVTSLLKLSKIDAGAVVFRSERIPIRRLLEKAVEPLLIPMELKEQELRIEGDPPEATVAADPNWTTEALVNLVKNAVEHAPCGGQIRLAYTENPLYAEIRVADNGEGIDPEDLPHVFERFYRGKTAKSDSVGIGLAMARSILVNQQAELTVRSDPGRGTEFSARFYKRETD
ncbi:sensor histidine kinase [Gorillibacterium sp. sgz500922]|uniref:sensor histidine kinase n=1 Tax=Gorillibacterium sp. sgz500922 TaxID=3446694 RepID=UPI003F6629E6